MNGPQHYIEAEAAYEKARNAPKGADRDVVDRYVNAAQFHATMAVAGALGQLVQLERQASPGVRSEWSRAFYEREPGTVGEEVSVGKKRSSCPYCGRTNCDGACGTSTTEKEN